MTGLATPTRNKYFYGKLLDTAHLVLEQDYVNGKRWLLNRLALGHGVLCGLEVAPTSNGQGVGVGKGVAIDHDGREIVVPAPSAAVDIRKLTDERGRQTGEEAAPGSIVTLGLAYQECPTEFVPTLTTDCDGKPDCEASSIQERYRLVLLGFEVPVMERACGTPGLWQWVQTGGPTELEEVTDFGTALRLDPKTVTDRASQACPEGGGDFLPLATITIPADGQELTTEGINQAVRPVVYSNELLLELLTCLAEELGGGQAPLPDIEVGPIPPRLTVVTAANWLIRGQLVGRMSVSDFAKGLIVDFTDAVRQPEGPGQGWFLVILEALGATRVSAEIAVERVREQEITFPDATRAMFVPHPETSKLIETLGVPLLCRVVLKCNVLIDGSGNPVDGDYRGNLPTGDGFAGGDFESWFILE
jgi:hypothetical protein